MSTHHGEALPGQTFVQNNACPKCGLLNTNRFTHWPIRTGEHVYACEPASAPAAAPVIDVENTPNYRQLTFDRFNSAGREDFDYLVEAGFTEQQVYDTLRNYPNTNLNAATRRNLWANLLLRL